MRQKREDVSQLCYFSQQFWAILIKLCDKQSKYEMNKKLFFQADIFIFSRALVSIGLIPFSEDGGSKMLALWQGRQSDTNTKKCQRLSATALSTEGNLANIFVAYFLVNAWIQVHDWWLYIDNSSGGFMFIGIDGSVMASVTEIGWILGESLKGWLSNFFL